MSCRRVRRELQEIVRFGDLAPSAASPHLDHLETCRACRDDVGLDRVLVGQLRRALAARIEPDGPPARAWYAILREAQRPEPRPSVWAWSHAIVGRLRTATAMAGTGLALVLALNMEVIPVGAPEAPVESGASEDVTLLEVPRMPTGRTALVVLSNRAGDAAGLAARPDPELALMQADTRLAPRSSAVAPAPEQGSSGPQLRLEVRPVRTLEHDPAAGTPDREDTAPGELVELQPGTPS
jgi:anti-sigma factor RsiW